MIKIDNDKNPQVKICRTFKLWELNKVFSYHSIQKCLNNANPDARKGKYTGTFFGSHF